MATKRAFTACLSKRLLSKPQFSSPIQQQSHHHHQTRSSSSSVISSCCNNSLIPSSPHPHQSTSLVLLFSQKQHHTPKQQQRRHAHSIPRPPVKPSSSSSSSSSSASSSTPSSPQGQPSPSPSPPPPPRTEQPAYELTFTCIPCSTRSRHRVSKHGYHHGSVLIACPGCKNRHVISDHLKIFGDRKITVEDLLKEKGQLIKKGVVGGDENDLEFWDDGTETPRGEDTDQVVRYQKKQEGGEGGVDVNAPPGASFKVAGKGGNEGSQKE